MAEATDRPRNEIGAAPSIPAVPGANDVAPEPYSSLSLLAVGGFVLGVGYAASMVVAAVIALLFRTPLLLPLWTLVFPIGAAVVCWAASVRIRNAEGALTGTRLTAWGFRMSLAVGSLYGAYYAATYAAVTSQATAFTEDWLNRLKQGQVDQAFALTLPTRPSTTVATKEDKDLLRSRLEIDFDHGGPLGPGPYTNFRQSELVRQFEQGGDADHWELMDVEGWSYEAGAYKVHLKYRITTPYLLSEAVLTAVSIENSEAGGRQWFIKEPQITSQPRPTAEGERMRAMAVAAGKFGDDWLAKVRDWQWDKAYLDTLPPAERKRQGAERGETFTRSLAAFRAGDLVHTDPEKFWAAPKEKDSVVADVRGLFGPGGENPDDLSLAGNMPMFWRDADQVRFGFDLTIRIKGRGALVLARLDVAADARGDDLEPGDWRIESVDLISGKGLDSTTPTRPGRPTPSAPRLGP